MATSAFKSTTKRSSIGSPSTTNDAGSSNRTGSHRRSRSLSRFSGRFTEVDSDELPVPRGRFVNTERGSGFPEISLDDLVSEFFPLKDSDEREIDRGRSARRSSGINPSMAGTTANRRGRSVSRQHGRTGDGKNFVESSLANKGVDNSRRRRSVSVAKYQFSDSESDHSINSNNHASLKSSRTVNDQRPSIHKPTATNHQRVLRRSMSQKDLSKAHDDYSSQSSALTDDESRDARSGKSESERTIRAVYAQKKSEHPTGDGVETGLYEVMRKELRSAVHEIRTELEQVMVKTKPSDLANSDLLQSNNSNVLQAVSLIRENYATRLEQSEKRKQDLLAEIVEEEQRGRELSKIVKDLLPDPKSTAIPQKPSRARKRSNDRSRMSKCLTEEAEKYFEGFISNVEDTDISSLDGERSDASSKLGGRAKSREPIIHFEETENFGTPTKSTSLQNEMDGVVLPWLQWETSNDGSPALCKSTPKVPVTPGNNLNDTAQEMSTEYNKSNCFISSHGSWSPGGDSLSVIYRDVTSSRYREADSEPRDSWFDMDEYLQLQHNESRFLENWRQRERINSACKLHFLTSHVTESWDLEQWLSLDLK
ncbi:hypothetical protein BVC80_1501g3 [Macleaya cordata]|uniref:Uncharacterized protein n=1 Tax=Macleaya cordata TaxID=56857 RepID=A0A200Q0Y5_MACCD|nr:hypothetical protein BVC80_1501g3 [Macleaya cordata]